MSHLTSLSLKVPARAGIFAFQSYDVMLVALPPIGGASSTTTTIANMKFEARSACNIDLAAMLQTLPVFDQSNRPFGVFHVWATASEVEIKEAAN